MFLLGGLCPGWSVFRGLSVQGGLGPGGSLSRGFSLAGEVSINGGSLSKAFCTGGLCPGGSLFKGSLSRGSLSRGGFCPRGLCPGLSGSPAQYSEERTVRILLECILVALKCFRVFLACESLAKFKRSKPNHYYNILGNYNEVIVTCYNSEVCWNIKNAKYQIILISVMHLKIFWKHQYFKLGHWDFALQFSKTVKRFSRILRWN